MRTALKAITAAAALVALAASAAPASGATMLTAGWSEGCGKTTCFNENGVFTKTWSTADAAGPITIGQLLLDRGVLGALDSKTFRLSFSLNGQELGTWGSFTMGAIAGDQLSFWGETFTWNPEDGDLVLVLELIPPPKAGLGGGFASIASEPSQDEIPGQEGDGGTRQPQQPDSPTTAVPEPSAWALMIGGFGLAGATFRRRRSVAQGQPCL